MQDQAKTMNKGMPGAEARRSPEELDLLGRQQQARDAEQAEKDRVAHEARDKAEAQKLRLAATVRPTHVWVIVESIMAKIVINNKTTIKPNVPQKVTVEEHRRLAHLFKTVVALTPEMAKSMKLE